MKKLDLVLDNTEILAGRFDERLNYLKGYFEARYKPLIFEYKMGIINHSLHIDCELFGEKRKVGIYQVIQPSASSKYNFDIVEEYIRNIKYKIENEIINEGIKSLG